MNRAATPPFILLFMGLCLLGMFAASFQSFLQTPLPPPAQRGVAARDAAPEPMPPQGLAEGDTSLALTEQQADDLTELMRRIQANPQDAEALTEIGEAFLMTKDWTRAGVFLARAVAAAPDDIRPRYMMGISLYQQSNMPEAAKIFEELLAIKDDTAAKYNLAVIYKYHLNKASDAHALFHAIAESKEADTDTRERAKKELE